MVGATRDGGGAKMMAMNDSDGRGREWEVAAQALVRLLPRLERGDLTAGGLLYILHRVGWVANVATEASEDGWTTERLANADIEALRSVLSFHAARERNHPGELERLIQDGRLRAVLTRLDELQTRVSPHEPTHAVRTSFTHPIEVGWIAQLRGRIGLTFAPGKKTAKSARATANSPPGPPWSRDLQADLLELVGTHKAHVLVCLLQDAEFEELQIPDYFEACRKYGLVVERLAIPDGSIPSSLSEVASLIARIVRRANDGETVVIHCRGGLGRAGTIGACALIALGKTPDEALDAVREARGAHAPENEEQRAFVRAFSQWMSVQRPTLDGFITAARNVSSVQPKASVPGPVPRPSAMVIALPTAMAPALADGIRGAVLGAAVGDAMGAPTEFLRTMEEIHTAFGPQGIERYVTYREADGKRFAAYTDDTQMAEIVLRVLVEARRASFDLERTMQRIADGFVGWAKNPQGGHRAPGNACLAGCRNLEKGVHWSQAGGATAGGCGSVMRAYPFGLVFHDDIARAEEWSVAHSQLTHRDPVALAACAAMAVGTAHALAKREPRYVVTEMAAAAGRYSVATAKMLLDAMKDVEDGQAPAVTLTRLEGWAAHECIAAAAYIFLRHPDDPRGAILEGANTIGDSDSIATCAAALVGARAGAKKLPPSWVSELERSDELAALAEQAINGR